MTKAAFIQRITAYFGPNSKYRPELLTAIDKIASRLGEDQLDVVFDKLMEDQSSRFQVGVKEIQLACQALGIGYKKATYIPAHEVTCDACGFSYQYAMAPDDEDRLEKNLHDYCPSCGFQYNWTIMANEYGERATPWYTNLLERSREWKRDNKRPYWDKAVAEKEQRQMRKAEIDRKMAQIDKRWDLKED